MKGKSIDGPGKSALPASIVGPTQSRFVRHLDRLLNESPKRQNEIAREIGYEKPNIITMFKQGSTRVPIDRVPLLADALEVDRVELVNMWLEEYQPALMEVLNAVGGPRLSNTERTWIRGLRRAFPSGVPVFDEIAESGLKDMVERNGPTWSKLDKTEHERNAAKMEAQAVKAGIEAGRAGTTYAKRAK